MCKISIINCGDSNAGEGGSAMGQHLGENLSKISHPGGQAANRENKVINDSRVFFLQRYEKSVAFLFQNTDCYTVISFVYRSI
jgi:hypothetical protein